MNFLKKPARTQPSSLQQSKRGTDILQKVMSKLVMKLEWDWSRDAKQQNIEKVTGIIDIDRRATVHYIAQELDFGQSTIYIILTEDLNKHHVCAR